MQPHGIGIDAQGGADNAGMPVLLEPIDHPRVVEAGRFPLTPTKANAGEADRFAVFAHDVGVFGPKSAMSADDSRDGRGRRRVG